MQLLLALLILVGVALGVFLIILLARLIGTLKRVSSLIDDIHEPVKTAAEQLPAVLSNVDAITKDVTVLTESINQTVPDILKDAQTMTGTAREGVEAVGNAARSVGEGFKSIFRPAASSSHASHLGSIIDIVSQIAGVVGYFTERKKDGAKAKRARGRRR
jgi:uncharacterized protein YoxC